MKKIVQFLILLFLIVVVIIAFNFKRLNIITGYSAKNMASSVFLANRDFYFTDTTDTNFTPIEIADNRLIKEERSITSSIFGITKRKAIYREGLGGVLTLSDQKFVPTNAKPKRIKISDTLVYPYGNKMHKDTIFESINYEQLNIAIDSVFNEKYKTRAVLVVHKDKIIAERYADGFNENSILLGWSMTKSVLSTLYGVMQYQGKVNLNDAVPVDEWQKDDRKNITYNNLLQMNCGLAWEEEYYKISDVTKMLYLEEDMSKTQMRKPLVGKPNESWLYSSGVSNLLSGIARQQFNTYQEYLDFWYTDLIDKIGMNSMILEADLKGNYVASSYGWATARDWSKLGLLYLKNGNWNGEQIFSKDWVSYATTPTPSSNGLYGAGIWLNTSKELPDVPENVYRFTGFQGQYVVMLPDHDMVIVRLGLVKDQASINDLVSGVIASIKS